MSQSHSTLVNFTANENIIFRQAVWIGADPHRTIHSSKSRSSDIRSTSLILDNVETSKPGYIVHRRPRRYLRLLHSSVAGGRASALGRPAEQFYTITDSGGGSFDFISFTTTSNGSDDIITHVQNVRIGGIDPPPLGDAVPEPASIALLGVGLLGLGTIVQRRRNPGLSRNSFDCDGVGEGWHFCRPISLTY